MEDVSQEIDLTIISLCSRIRREIKVSVIDENCILPEIIQALAKLIEAKACITTNGCEADIDKLDHQIQEHLLKQFEGTL